MRSWVNYFIGGPMDLVKQAAAGPPSRSTMCFEVGRLFSCVPPPPLSHGPIEVETTVYRLVYSNDIYQFAIFLHVDNKNGGPN